MKLKEAPCGYLAFDDERIITSVNDEARRYLGYDSEALEGQSLALLLPPAVRMLFHANVYPALAEGERVDEVYALLRRRDGTDLPVLLTATRCEEEGRYETHCVFLAVKRRDSFTRHLERLETSQSAPASPQPAAPAVVSVNQAQAQRLSTLGLLLASVMHEINNPLTYVICNLDLLLLELDHVALDAPTLATLADCETEMRDGLERIRQLARSVSLVSRAESEALVPFQVGEVVDTAVRLVAHRVRQTAPLEVRGPRPGGTGRGDVARLVQVVMNLLINAAQALSGHPAEQNTICVSNGTSEGALFIEVIDNGPGIPEALQERIFDPFYTTKPVGEGTGLGLTICRQIVTSLGGRLEHRATPGGGATFRITLPSVSEEQLF